MGLACLGGVVININKLVNVFYVDSKSTVGEIIKVDYISRGQGSRTPTEHSQIKFVAEYGNEYMVTGGSGVGESKLGDKVKVYYSGKNPTYNSAEPQRTYVIMITLLLVFSLVPLTLFWKSNKKSVKKLLKKIK